MSQPHIERISTNPYWFLSKHPKTGSDIFIEAPHQTYRYLHFIWLFMFIPSYWWCCCRNSQQTKCMFEWCTRSQYNVKAITEKPSNVLLEQRYHKRCIYCDSEWLFRSSTRLAHYLATATCQEVFMSHGFVSRFYYRIRLFNALYITCMSTVAF